VEELKQLELEIRKIETKMKENKQKALRETDPVKKQALIAEIEKDGKLLEQKYREHQEHSNKYNFDATAKVRGMIEAMKKAIEDSFKKPRGGGSGGGNNPNRPNRPNKDPDGPFGGSGGGGGNNPDDDKNKTPPRKREEKQAKDNSPMILIAIAAVFILFFLMNQKERPSRDYEEDYY
jgi:hypothetical protein